MTLDSVQLSAVHTQLHASFRPFFLVRTQDGKTTIAPVEEYATFFANVPVNQVIHFPFPRSCPRLLTSFAQRTIGFVDPSAQPQNPGWPLRNLLAYLLALHPADVAQGVRVLCWRDVELPAPGSAGGWRSRFGVVKQGSGEAPAAAPMAKPAAVGWEKNIQGKLGPRVADLAPMMDPARCVPLR